MPFSRCHVSRRVQPSGQEEPGQQWLTGLVKGEEDNASSTPGNEVYSEPFLPAAAFLLPVQTR
ncbi:hypothetical protein ABIC03_007070 [Bradyrhizobium sp. RT6a]